MVPEKFQHLVAFRLGQLVDPLGEATVHKKPLPSRHRVRADDRVYSAQTLTDVVRRSAVLSERRAIAVGDVDESLAHVRSGQPVKELLVRRRKSVVCFVCASPQGVAADGRQFADDK